MTTPARIPQGTPVTLESIAKQYGNRRVLDNIQLRISAGQFVAVWVPSILCVGIYTHMLAERAVQKRS